MLCSRSASLTSSTRMSLADREQELAEVLGGALVLGLRLDLAELGHPVDQLARRRDRKLSMSSDVASVSSIVSWRMRGDDGLVVELEVGENARDLDRVAEIGVAGGAHLRAVGLHREDVGAVNQPFVRVGIVGPDLLDKLILSQHEPKMVS